jgi:hypothetical protein
MLDLRRVCAIVVLHRLRILFSWASLCDTPTVTVATTVFEQYLAMYFRSLNEILASLVCIISIVKFKFQIQTRFFYSNQALFSTYFVSQILTLKCSQLNSLLSRPSQEGILENYHIFPGGLNPF